MREREKGGGRDRKEREEGERRERQEMGTEKEETKLNVNTFVVENC